MNNDVRLLKIEDVRYERIITSAELPIAYEVVVEIKSLAIFPVRFLLSLKTTVAGDEVFKEEVKEYLMKKENIEIRFEVPVKTYDNYRNKVELFWKPLLGVEKEDEKDFIVYVSP